MGRRLAREPSRARLTRRGRSASWVQRSPLDPVTYILRKFSFVRGLERSIRRQEQVARDARAERERAEADNRILRAERAEWTRFCVPGHFYSPVPSREEIERASCRGGHGPPFAAIDMRDGAQLELLKEFAGYYPGIPFSEAPAEGRRFHLANDSYGPHDACILYCMMRHLRPRRVVEVGCGNSSAALLDLGDALFGGSVGFTFIDPDLSKIRGLLLPGDSGRVTLVEKAVQDAPDDVFRALEANDILFIDSSHISKVGSDVNHLFFRILPALRAGVCVHIHDVTGDFEYPRHWLEEGRAWNEMYLLRAFLMYNRTFSVMYASAWVYNRHHDVLSAHLPMCAAGGGGQIWLRKESAD